MTKTQKRRRREGKTDYLHRLKLLKGETPRIVFRKTNRYFIVQYIISKEAKDIILFGSTSKELMKFGWPKNAEGSLKSIPAGYFMGLLTGRKITNKKLQSPIIDFGMIRPLHGTKIFAFLKGLTDAGIKIECKKEIFPNKERIMGESLKNKISFEEIKTKIEKS